MVRLSATTGWGRPLNKKNASIVLGLAGTSFFLWLALRKVSLAELVHALRGAHWLWLLPMATIVAVDIFIRAVRWRVLLSRARKDASILELARLEVIGLGVNNVLFMRLGELARGALAARRLGIPIFAALASVVVERALDVSALLTLFILATFAAPGFVPPAVRFGAIFILSGAIVALMVLALAETAIADGGVIEKALRRAPKIHKLVEQLSLGASVLRRPAAALQAAGLSLLLWMVDAGLYWAGARALGIGAVMDYPRAVLALSWAGASSALPAAPGAIGTFEAVITDILMKFGAAANEALAYALVCHMVMYLLVTVTGLVLLYRVGLSLTDLRSEVDKQ